MTTFSLGKPGGGGVGGVVELYAYCTCELIVNDKPSSSQVSLIDSNKRNVILHLIEVFRAHFPNFPRNVMFKMSTKNDLGEMSHVGLSSTSSCAMSVLFAMNEMFEPKPFKRVIFFISSFICNVSNLTKI